MTRSMEDKGRGRLVARSVELRSGKACGKVRRRTVARSLGDKVRERPVVKSEEGLWQGQ